MRKLLIVTVLAVVLVSVAPGLIRAVAPEVKVTLNGEYIAFDVKPIIQKGRTLVPIRAIAEKMGGTVTWDEKTETVGIVKDDVIITVVLKSSVAHVNGAVVRLDVPAQAVRGRTLVPLRFVSESLGARVDWDQSRMTVVIDVPGQTPEEPPAPSETTRTIGDYPELAAAALGAADFRGEATMKFDEHIAVADRDIADVGYETTGVADGPNSHFAGITYIRPAVGSGLQGEENKIEEIVYNNTVYVKTGDSAWQVMNPGEVTTVPIEDILTMPVTSVTQETYDGLPVTKYTVTIPGDKLADAAKAMDLDDVSLQNRIVLSVTCSYYLNAANELVYYEDASHLQGTSSGQIVDARISSGMSYRQVDGDITITPPDTIQAP